jgi:hypothetical protein
MYDQLLLIAPSPESKPRMMMPTMSRAEAAVIAWVSVIGDWSAAGRGMWENRKLKRVGIY